MSFKANKAPDDHDERTSGYAYCILKDFMS